MIDERQIARLPDREADKSQRKAIFDMIPCDFSKAFLLGRTDEAFFIVIQWGSWNNSLDWRNVFKCLNFT